MQSLWSRTRTSLFKFSSRVATSLLIIASMSVRSSTEAFCQNNVGRSDLKLDTSTLNQYAFLPPSLKRTAAGTLRESGSPQGAREGSIVQSGSLGFGILAVDALKRRGGYWRDYDFDVFAVRYRDNPAPLLDEASLPEELQSKLLRARSFGYGKDAANTGDTLLGKLSRLVDHGVLPLSVVESLSAREEDEPEWSNRSRGGALVGLQSPMFSKFPKAVICQDDVFSDTEIVDSFAALLYEVHRGNSPTRWGKGAPRGSPQDGVIPSPERYSMEERLGVRDLSPDDLQKLLHQAVRPDGPGVVIDEASDPRCRGGCHFEVWERPVRDFFVIKKIAGLQAQDLPYDLVVRYAPILAEVYGDSALKESIASGLRRALASLDELDAAFDAFQRASPEQKNAALKKYHAARIPYRNILNDELLSPASKLWERMQLAKDDQPWQLRIATLVVNFQRERIDPLDIQQPLTSKEYVFISLAQGAREGAWTWLSQAGDYPPDYAYIPAADWQTQEYVTKLVNYFKGCESIDEYVVK